MACVTALNGRDRGRGGVQLADLVLSLVGRLQRTASVGESRGARQTRSSFDFEKGHFATENARKMDSSDSNSAFLLFSIDSVVAQVMRSGTAALRLSDTLNIHSYRPQLCLTAPSYSDLVTLSPTSADSVNVTSLAALPDCRPTPTNSRYSVWMLLTKRSIGRSFASVPKGSESC